MRTNSVLSYILLGLEKAGRNVEEIEPVKENVNGNADNNANKTMQNPTEMNNDPIFGVKFDKTRVNQMILEDQLEYTIQDKGINVQTHQGNLTIEFKPEDSDRPRFHWYCVITVRYRRLVGRLSTVSVMLSMNS